MIPGTTLTVAVDAQGRLTVSGPIENKAVCYAMLECAKDAVRDHADHAAASPIVPAHSMPGGTAGPRLHQA